MAGLGDYYNQLQNTARTVNENVLGRIGNPIVQSLLYNSQTNELFPSSPLRKQYESRQLAQQYGLNDPRTRKAVLESAGNVAGMTGGISKGGLNAYAKDISSTTPSRTSRPEFELAFERAFNNGDKGAIMNAFQAIPKNSPYKASATDMMQYISGVKPKVLGASTSQYQPMDASDIALTTKLYGMNQRGTSGIRPDQYGRFEQDIQGLAQTYLDKPKNLKKFTSQDLINALYERAQQDYKQL